MLEEFRYILSEIKVALDPKWGACVELIDYATTMDAGERSECFISEAHSLKSALTYRINLAPCPFLNTKKR